MRQWPLDREGFVTRWMVSGPRVTPFESELRDRNQLRYEATLRRHIARHEPVDALAPVRLGEPGRLGEPWRVHYDAGAVFVDLSAFYSLMRRVDFDMAAVLTAPRPMRVRAVLWSWTAADVYLNGVLLGGIESPVYKPIERRELEMDLRAGANTVYVACETLGVRDTRSAAALQLPGLTGEVTVTLPDALAAETCGPVMDLMDGARLTRDALVLPVAAPAGARYTFKHGHYDLKKELAPAVWLSAEGLNSIPLPEGEPYVTLEVPAGGRRLVRRFERTEQLLPQYVRPTPSYEENRELIFRRIADAESLTRGEKFGFPISMMLARRHFGETSPEDPRLMREMLDLIESRVDCSDFLMSGLIRYVRRYRPDDALMAEIRRVMLGWRYWMDMDGFDGMCFWSENHALMFYSCAMGAGALFPDDTFTLAQMTGRELAAWGRAKVVDWLDDVERGGFEEFLSTVYMCVTFAALVNAVDFSDAEISRRAAAVTDRLLEMLAMHTFKDGIIAPMGRVYRGAIHPFNQGALALMNLIDPSLPWSFGEGWLGFWASSGYRLPEGLRDLMHREISTAYTTGNARVFLEKHPDWCLTSVASPREDTFDRWENLTLRDDADPGTHAFTKSYNERFHGTTCFQPGVAGYQQHLWYAALDGEAVLMVNHPGSTSETGDMRPGYWHGNGVFPALKQQGPLLGGVYRIPEDQPLHFVHLYCPDCRFDEVVREERRILLRKGTGYLAFWSSAPLEDHDGFCFGCEKRMYGDETAFAVLCGGREYADMAAFRAAADALAPSFDGRTLRAGGLTLTWRQGEDRTQFL